MNILETINIEIKQCWGCDEEVKSLVECCKCGKKVCDSCREPSKEMSKILSDKRIYCQECHRWKFE